MALTLIKTLTRTASSAISWQMWSIVLPANSQLRLPP